MKYLVIAVCIGSAVARPDGAGGHHAHHAAAAPSTGYEVAQPAAGYEQPSGYAAPSGYEQPSYESGYGAPSGYSSGYGVADEGGEFDLRFLMIPILLIAGLALLFPSVTQVQIRKKRSEDEVSGNSLMDRVQDIFLSVVQSGECMERISCEVGGILSDSSLSDNALTAAEAFVPAKYKKFLRHFNDGNNGNDCHNIKCGTF